MIRTECDQHEYLSIARQCRKCGVFEQPVEQGQVKPKNGSMILKDNAHNHLVSNPWGWVDIIDDYGKPHQRVFHWAGYEQREKMQELINQFNKLIK